MNKNAIIGFLGGALTVLVMLMVSGMVPFFDQFAAISYSVPSKFVLNQPAGTCNGQLPIVNLSWSASTNASSYQIQRKNILTAPWSGVLDTQIKSLTAYNDSRFKIDYGAATTTYRIVAVNGSKKTFSNEISIKIPECRVARLSQIPPTVQTTPISTTTVITSTTSNVVNTKMPAGLKWGAYVGWQDAAMDNFETLIGKKPDMEMVFSHWGNDVSFPNNYNSRIRDKGRTMVLFWEAVDYSRDYTKQPEYGFDAVLSGKLDSYFKSYASGAKSYNGPVIIALYSEFNGNWFPWSGTVGSNTPQKYIDSFRYIKTFFADVPNVKFAWVVNSDSVPDTSANQIDLFYPGDDYVDYVGVDGFNFGGTAEMTFTQVFSKPLTSLKKYNKPTYIFSMAATENPNKAAWITNALTVELYKYPEVKGWLWFNESKERDWRVNSNQESLSAFKNALP